MITRFALSALLGLSLGRSLAAAELAPPPPPRLTGLAVSNAAATVEWLPYPHAERYRLLSATNLADGWAPELEGTIAGFRWTGSVPREAQFLRLAVEPMSSNALLTAQVLNRLAYGPTPDELERVAAIGPDAYIEEQLASENLPALDVAVSRTTNSTPAGAGPRTNWVRVVATGRLSTSTLYVYLAAVGEVYVDDLRLVSGTDPDGGVNVLANGDFEAPLSSGWTVSPNVAQSRLSTDVVHSGQSSLRLISTSPGSSGGTALQQTILSSLTNNEVVTLSYWYVPTSNSHYLTVRLSNSGTASSGADQAPPPQWYYVTQTGYATSSRNIYLYLSGAGEAYIDELKLVAGRVAEAGPNLVQNGDFESALTGPWQLTADFTNTVISREMAFSGSGSLKLVATAAGGGSGDAVYQTIASGLTNGQLYTVSYWYLPATQSRRLTVRLGSSGAITPTYLSSDPDTAWPGLRRRLEAQQAEIEDLRAWHIRNAVGSPRQLLEVLLQYWENHFVTEHAKSDEYMTRYYGSATVRDRLVTEWEFRENARWRAALLRPQCTFLDLLTVSAESPAMIVYLDTVASRGDGVQVANENYARELFELFCMGVDNGYDQNDIVAMSRAWTGWYVDLLDVKEADNPFAQRSTTYSAWPGNGSDSVTNRVGIWTFRYREDRHGTNRAPLLSVWSPQSTAQNLIALGPKTVPARFGPPWAGMPYQLTLPARTGTNGIQDGYDVLRHLANLPFTMEYISIKMCRLFVHDDFPNPTTRPDLPEYAFYDYTNPNRSPEAELVHQCMLAWWNSEPRGQLRPVLRTLFQSDLFRTRHGALQKIKTPLEFAVSTVRALRADQGNGGFTSDTDGYSIAGTSRSAANAPLTRMGLMMLFDRESPDGYPESGSPWISAGTLSERVRFVQTTLMSATDTNKTDGIDGGNRNVTDPVALLRLKLPSAAWNDAGAVADFFVRLLYPAEGAANLDQYRDAAVTFLNTADNGTAAEIFAGLSQGTPAYDTRVRGMVAMLMTFQRFQEQ